MKLQITLLLALASTSLGAMEGPKHALNFFTRKIAEYQADLAQVRELIAANLVVRKHCEERLDSLPIRFYEELLSADRKKKRFAVDRGRDGAAVSYEQVCYPHAIISDQIGRREVTIGEMLTSQLKALEVEESTISCDLQRLEELRELAKSMNK